MALVAALLALQPRADASSSAGGASVAVPSARVVRPHQDGFYRYTGRKPLRRIAPGTVTRKRTVSIKLAGRIPTPIRAQQLQFRTRDQRGRPTIGVTTVVAPLGKLTGNMLGYLSFYDGLGDQCNPSYTLRGGDAGTAGNNQQAAVESLVVLALAAQGYVVTVPDFEGIHQHWVAGQESGWNTLDAVRATRNAMEMRTNTKVGLMGYSGGSIGGEWAAELAPRYAPDVNLIGVAVGGMPVHLAHNLKYIDGKKTWSGVMPAVFASLGRAFGLKVNKYASRYGQKLIKVVSRQCIGSFSDNYPGLRMKRLLKPRYRGFLKIKPVRRIVNRLIMGSTPGHPKVPMYLAVADGDGTGDGVMIVKDAAALAHQYCRQGLPIAFDVFKRSDHTEGGIQFIPQAITYLLGRFLGGRAPSDCGRLPKGNSLAPVGG